MIDYINGKIVQKALGYVVVDCNNIGYKLMVSNNTSYDLNIDEYYTIYTYLVVKEDAFTLIGFNTLEERGMFEVLIGVSKIGVKTALSILSIYRASDIAKFVKSKDIVSLSKVPGLGKKTAERLILELKDKIDVFIDSNQISKIEESKERLQENIAIQEAIDALSMLGFTTKESQAAVKKSMEIKESDDVQELIRMSLAILKK